MIELTAGDQVLLRSLERELRIAPWQAKRRSELVRYLEDRGPGALARQVELGQTHFRCCWNRLDEGHADCCPEARR